MIGGGKERTGTTGTQTVTIAIGNPAASAMTTKRTAKFGISKNGKTCVVSWMRNHATTP